MRVLRNCWYMIAWVNELDENSNLTRTVADEPILVERSAQGEVSARALISCKRQIAVRAKHRMLWIWLGDAEDADPSTIPDFSSFDDVKETAFFAGCLPTSANYELLTDNILDLSHADFLHPTTLGGMMTRAVPSLERNGNSLTMTWDSPDGPALPLFDMLLPEPGKPAHVRITVRWVPAAAMHLKVDFAPAGEPLEKWFSSWAAHIMTPESEYQTHYFYGAARNYMTDNGEVNAFQAAAIREAFATEDKPIIEAQQREMGTTNFWDLRPALLTIDRGPVMARRKLAQLISEESDAA